MTGFPPVPGEIGSVPSGNRGDDASGDADHDGICADLDCDDGDPTNACAAIFADDLESGDTSAWSATVG